MEGRDSSKTDAVIVGICNQQTWRGKEKKRETEKTKKAGEKKRSRGYLAERNGKQGEGAAAGKHQRKNN